CFILERFACRSILRFQSCCLIVAYLIGEYVFVCNKASIPQYSKIRLILREQIAAKVETMLRFDAKQMEHRRLYINLTRYFTDGLTFQARNVDDERNPLQLHVVERRYFFYT